MKQQFVSGSSTFGGNLTLVYRAWCMSINVGYCHNTGLKIIVILQSHIVNNPDTKSQQESKQKYCPISPVEIQRVKEFLKEILHLIINKLLLFSKVLNKSLFAYADLYIVINFDKNAVILNLGNGTVNTTDSNNLVTLLK